MGKPKTAPVGTKLRSGKHAKAVENSDFKHLRDILNVSPMNRKQRREAAKRKKNA